jgi:membrane associated rhomboid family serine protease
MFLPLRADTPRLRYPAVTVALAVANLAVYLFELTLDPADQLAFARAAGAIPWEVTHLHDLVGPGQPVALLPPPLTIFSAMFVHGDLLHLGGNLWFLWLFGSRLEGAMGHLRYAALYFAAGTVAALLQVAVTPDLTVPMIGASGAIAGVLSAYAFAFPGARVSCVVFLVFFLTVVSLPAWVLLGLWFLGQFASAGGRTPGVAWFAHAGGFLAGLAIGRALVRPWPRALAIVYHSPA